MPKFSSSSIAKLAECHSDLQVLFNTVIEQIDCTVLEGHRDQAAQEAAFNAGNSKLHYPFGKHNATPSLAADVAPFPVDWKNLNRFYWFAGYVLGVADRLYIEGKIIHRVRWGGDWNHNYDITDEKGLIDLPHFELIK